MMQELAVFTIVALAAVSLAWRYLPAALKQLAAAGLAAVFSRMGWQRAAARFSGSAERAACGDGCGSCGGCGSGEQSRPSSEFAITPENLRRTARR